VIAKLFQIEFSYRSQKTLLTTQCIDRQTLYNFPKMANTAVPKFTPKPGQIDYTNARWAPVINCVVMYKGKILIVKRSSDMPLYPDYWNGISGFLDDDQSLDEKVAEELREELNLVAEHIVSIKLGEIFHADDPKYQKTWIVHPVLVEIDTDEIKLDWESQEYKWIEPSEAINYKLLPSFDRVVASLT
jgi:8-oxo-dGTP pyrophosphatase MutT (NUDIX family)